MTKHFDYIAFFDLDGTLLKINSGKVLIRRAHEAGLINTLDMIHAIYLSLLYKFDLKGTTQIVSQMPKWLAGVSEQKISDFSEKIFKNELVDLIRPEMVEEIKKHRGNNARLVILSAAMSYICKPLARYLKFDDIICSELEVVDGLFTGNTQGRICLNDEKPIKLSDYCTLHKCSVKNVYYFGDSIEDLPVLDVVGYPICINPDKKLAKAAIRKGWTIHNWE